MAIEFSEQNKTGAEAVDNSKLIKDSFQERPSAQTQHERESASNKLVDNGTLPQLDLFSSPELHSGKEMSPKELAKDGINSKSYKNDDGSKETKTDFPNGVRVTINEGGKVVTKDGRSVELGPSNMVDVSRAPNQPMRESSPGSGVLVDKNGKEVAKQNTDGSVSVDTGDSVYTVHPDGTTSKEVFIRSRDGKSWDILHTETPLGNLKK